LRVPEYAEKLTTEGVNPTAKPEVVREGPSFVTVDGRNSMGQIGTALAMRKVIGKAAQTGIAAGAIRGSNHCGAMAYFTRMALPHDMIGIATTNAIPTMAPWGGAERILGINPLAISVPAGEMSPIAYDAAFSGSSHGKIRIYQQKGMRIPEGWVIDREGQPTTDPMAAVDGLLAPIGGFKGAGLAMIMGILSSMLSGACYGTELGSIEEGPIPGEDGHFVAAIYIASFEDVELKPTPLAPIPIWYGGGTPASCRRAVDYSDGWMPGRIPLATFHKCIKYLHDLCDKAGKPMARCTP